MRDYYKSIHIINPVRGNGYYRYDVVYLGRLIPNYTASEIPNKLRNEYVFIFSTYLNPDDEKNHGSTYVKIEKEYKISHFASEILEQTHFHNLMDDSNIFEINEFVTIEKSELDHGFTIVAQVNNQNVYSDTREVIGKKDRYILLVRENLKYDNVPALELGAKFDYQIKIDWYENIIWELQDCKYRISTLDRNASDDEKAAIEIVSQLLEKKYTELEQIKKMYEKEKQQLKF